MSGQPHTAHTSSGQSAWSAAAEYAESGAKAELDRLKEEPMSVGTVVDLRDDDRMTISMGFLGTFDVSAIDGAKVGSRVLCHRNTLQPIEVLKDKVPVGTITVVKKTGKGYVEVEVEQKLRAVASSFTCKVGERVVLDDANRYVVGTLGMPPAENAFATSKVSVSWGDVGGQEEAKEALREALELPLAHADLYKAYGKRGVKGVLLLGSPGTGKTLLGKAAATSIAKAHGHAASEGFIYIKGPEILSKWIGESERQIRAIFSAAREHKARHGYPAIVFIDECDALLGVRDRGSNTNLNATIVPQFLAEMDGLDDSAAIFILATNRADMLDPAVVREGRIDRKVRVTRPVAQDARKIFEIHLRGRPLTGSSHIDRGVDELYADHRMLRRIDEKSHLRLRDMVSGAMIAGIVEQASTFALLRDVEDHRRAATGISPEQIVMAIDRAQAALAETDHGEVIREMIEDQRRKEL
jgi:proteasome ATPase